MTLSRPDSSGPWDTCRRGTAPQDCLRSWGCPQQRRPCNNDPHRRGQRGQSGPASGSTSLHRTLWGLPHPWDSTSRQGRWSRAAWPSWCQAGNSSQPSSFRWVRSGQRCHRSARPGTRYRRRYSCCPWHWRRSRVGKGRHWRYPADSSCQPGKARWASQSQQRRGVPRDRLSRHSHPWMWRRCLQGIALAWRCLAHKRIQVGTRHQLLGTSSWPVCLTKHLRRNKSQRHRPQWEQRGRLQDKIDHHHTGCIERHQTIPLSDHMSLLDTEEQAGLCPVDSTDPWGRCQPHCGVCIESQQGKPCIHWRVFGS